MKKILIISILFFVLQIAFTNCSFAGNKFYRQNIADTVIPENIKIEDKAIDEVIKSSTPPKQEKVKYVSQVTKYGFKDLFKNYSYNPSIPYTAQVNPHAETYMQDYLQAHGKYLEHMKATALPYFNLIDGILTQYGLPKELKYLAVIESDLKSNALSIAGARGPWQLMPYTAEGYGLKVNQNVDDRTDYTKSTNAAAKYLLSLYKNFNDWLLVIAAYNGGPGRVYTAINKSGSRNFWKLQYYLPEESRNHVKKFIATHFIMETSTNNNFDYTSLNGVGGVLKPDMSEEESANSDSMKVSGRYIASIIAKNIDMDINDFNRYNPGFDNTMASGDTVNMRLPNAKMPLFITNKYGILNECVQHLLGEANFDTKTIYKKKASK
ncbi:lytic transglycosylase domain-containing protein [Ginsengibacter hankyongi]|uniref:Lytic transglycosylase domain-containing protein n=1 Tax=Ginsengibacter hankyongi TaxID=2607284 RepID=A0A5J5IMR6_9BACT|nr:lytic transglycosylase domain-containing protein [Ginsengibacter hankyongi]KAA9041593.1 lytic transglycosylase domain-containing protein [Ginsengibacter hankyongi]